MLVPALAFAFAFAFALSFLLSLLLRCSVLRHLRLGRPSGLPNAARLTKPSDLVEEVVLGVIALAACFSVRYIGKG